MGRRLGVEWGGGWPCQHCGRQLLGGVLLPSLLVWGVYLFMLRGGGLQGCLRVRVLWGGVLGW